MAKRFVLPFFLGGIQDSIRKHPLCALALAFTACAILLVAAVVVGVVAFAGLSGELRERKDRAEALTRNLVELSEDYNSLRASLGLQPRVFAPLDESAGEAGAPPSPLAQGLAVIQSRFYDEAKARQFEEFKSGPLFAALARETGCAPVDAGLFAVDWVRNNNVYYSLAFKVDARTVALTAAGVGERYEGADKDAAAAYVRSTLKKIDAYYGRVAGLKTLLAGLGSKEEVAAALKARELGFKFQGEDAAGFRAEVSRENEVLLTVSFDKMRGVFLIGGKEVDPPETLGKEFAAALDALDARTAAEKRADAVKASLEQSFREPDFAAACKGASMETVATPRENDDFYLYDVRHRGGKIGAFAVDKRTAEVFFVDKDDVVIASLRSVSSGSEFKKKNPLIGDESGARTYLLLGRNEKNTDTMILVRADERTKSIILVSLPRDLYYRGRKINHLNEKGGDYCAREISAVTGVPVEKYALIDIYSLIAVIDALGGVDIDLPYDVVDPSYRVKENGVWRTLAYPRGRYHLSGVQALRLIRSRGTSSDFQRSHRQELILGALFTKLKKRCGGNLEASLSVFAALSSYVTTNLSPLEIARDFVSFKDYAIRGSYVVDTTNILRATYLGIYLLPEEEQARRLEENDPVKLDAYILLPRDNDWNLLRSYVRSLLKLN
ncbi:MAG: LCP family protein [Spirochaetales bacterium]|nr:LCP family protein [Spirochaetales bacterium]